MVRFKKGQSCAFFIVCNGQSPHDLRKDPLTDTFYRQTLLLTSDTISDPATSMAAANTMFLSVGACVTHRL